MFRKTFQSQKGTYAQKANALIKNSIKRIPGDEKEHYDYTPVRYKKRMDTAVKGINKMYKELSGVCDDTFIEAYFLLTNSLIMRGGYNSAVDNCNFVSFSAAIWILDQLTLEGMLEDVYEFLPSVREENTEDDILAPYVNHPLYDYNLILSVVRLIRQRNSSKEFQNSELGTLQWDAGSAEKDRDSQSNRKAFDSVLACIDSTAIAKAVEKYEDKIWEFYRLAFKTMSCIERHVDKLSNELADIEERQSALLKNTLGAKPSSVLMMQTKAGPFEMLSGGIKSDDELENRSMAIRMEIDYLEGITFTKFSLANDREKTMRKLKKIIPDETAEAITHFHVDDPFETAFALLYLLDTGSDIPWFYYGSISVAYTMCDQLPYDSECKELEEPALLSDWNEALYEHRYRGYRWPERTDASDEPVKREYAKNLGQLIYSHSMSLFPRVIPKLSGLETFLDGLGDLTAHEKEAYSLLLYALHSESLRSISLNEYQLVHEAEEADATSTDKVQTEARGIIDDIAAVQMENERLRDKNARLVSALQETQRVKKIKETRFDILTEEVERQRKELSDLREKAYMLDHQEIQDEPADNSILFPYSTSERIISFGGHASWINEMRKRLPNVIFVAPETLPNADLIRGADVVWIQINCLSHSSYYKIIDSVKIGKQVRYFVFSGAHKCAEQVVRSVERLK